MTAPHRLAPLAAAALSLAAACDAPPPVTPPPPAAAPPAAAPPAAAPPAAAAARKLDAIPRLDFNRVAQELNLPLFWVSDKNGSGAVDPDEVVTLWGLAKPVRWVERGAFTPAFGAAFDAMARAHAEGHPRAGVDDAEKKRRELVLRELAQGRPSLLHTDLRAAPAEDRAIVTRLLNVAPLIDRIYLKQRGADGLEARLPADDPASRTLFWRNHGPWCEQPKTEGDPACSAVPGQPPAVSGLYPAALQKDPKFCQALDARADQKALLAPFSVVADKAGALEAVPYHVAYKAEMDGIAAELDAAAAAVQSPGEAPFKAYLAAAAQAFRDNRWEPADEAWAKMNVENSKWYLRVGPDEVYFEPCSRKAGFHMSFARINQDSLAWQKKLEPVKGDLEAAYAKLAGAPYKARKVTFHLPDFLDVVLNAGDSRSATGGTAGQSLPNWGPVANEGRGRTVAMVNLLQDEDSRAALRTSAASLLCKGALELVSFDPAIVTMGTVLHEAAHNLGPSHEYKAGGKTDAEIFGGPLAATLEELKAQNGALYFPGWLVQRGILDAKTAERSVVRDVLWAFRQISEGMYAEGGKPKPYPQLAAIQGGYLLEAGALVWNAEQTAANGQDRGCFSLEMQKLPVAVEGLTKLVLGIKARGDKAAALKLREAHVDKDGTWKTLRGVIQERVLRMPGGSVVYAVDL